MRTSSLIILLLGITFPGFESVPQSLDGEAESKLLSILQAAKGMKWNQQVEDGMKKIIEDEEGGMDPEKEAETVRDEIAVAYKRILMLNPSDEMQLKDDFRRVLGSEEAEDIFDEAEKIMWQELQEQARIDKELSLKTSQKKAFDQLVKDVKHGKDPSQEGERVVKKLKEDAAKILTLSPQEQEEEKYKFYAEYGEETGEKVFQAIKAINEAEVEKAAASTHEEVQGPATAAR
ncbi:PREDICTED: stress response protein NST1-like isoform X1 [Branchiostoma belcheri]|uniref:Stress response protein NST1-like isoform X1 n=1 Tax=Branchiostoma belcheri TaxID=7741 RepID=A0A6P4Z251_BRABE|nr:PREDICTED: stress response protein NST1-like isoform X1 [Branchiostoma belcheri]